MWTLGGVKVNYKWPRTINLDRGRVNSHVSQPAGKAELAAGVFFRRLAVTAVGIEFVRCAGCARPNSENVFGRHPCLLK